MSCFVLYEREEIIVTAYLIVCPLVFLAGLVDSIAGGGGLISLPGYLIAGVPAHLALGTNKMGSTIGTSISAVRLLKHGYLKGKMKMAIASAVCAMTGSVLGAKVSLLVFRFCDPAYDDRGPSDRSLSVLKKQKHGRKMKIQEPFLTKRCF
mgnify:CR=1 FL=1